MHSNLDAYFYMTSKGSSKAYEMMFRIYQKRVEKIIWQIKSLNTNFPGIPDDFVELANQNFSFR